MWAELLWLSAALAAGPAVVEPLPGGDTLVVVVDHRVPLVEVSVTLPAGRLSPWWAEGAPVAWYLPLTQPAWADVSQAAQLSVSHDDRSATMIARFRTPDADAAVAAMAAMLRSDEVDRAVLQAWRRGGLTAPWRLHDASPQQVLRSIAAHAVLADGDPRRAVPEPSLSARRVRQAQDWLPRLPGRIVSVAGDLSVEQAREAAARLLPPPLERPPDGLQVQLPPPPEVVPEAARARAPARGRGWVVTARAGLAADDPDLASLWLAMHALSVAGRSRMYRALRHERGLVYGVDTQLGIGPQPDVLMVVAACRLSNLDAVAEQSRAVVDRFASEGVTEAELQAARAALRQAAAEILGSPSRLRAHQVAVLQGGMDLLALAEAAEAVSLSSLNRFVAAFFGPGRVSVISVLPGGGDWSLD